MGDSNPTKQQVVWCLVIGNDERRRTSRCWKWLIVKKKEGSFVSHHYQLPSTTLLVALLDWNLPFVANKIQSTMGKKSVKSILRTGDSSSPSSSYKELAWGDLEIYEFQCILGDNPATAEGCPLTLSWKHQSKEVVGVDYNEFMRQNETKRGRRDLYIPGGTRDT